MEKKLFADLVTSLKEAAAISRGKARPSRQFKVTALAAKLFAFRTGRRHFSGQAASVGRLVDCVSFAGNHGSLGAEPAGN